MSKPIIIVESPAKAKTITKYLNHKFKVLASMGHVRDLPKKELGVDVEKNFKPKYVTDPSKKKIITELKKSTADADAIYLAPDHDREGEAIAWHLAKILEKEIQNKPVYRIVFNEITQKAIKEAIDKPGSIDINKVDAQQARRILDRIVGYKISPLLWKLINPSLSAGRVQSVALRLICERDDVIKAFVPSEYWSIETEFYRDDLPKFKAELTQFDGKKANMENETQALAILSELDNQPSQITTFKQSERFIHPPPPYITSTLQQDASKLINFSGKKTMMVAQKLYEGLEIDGETTGLITYMRTDSIRTSDEANQILREFIERTYGADKLNETIRTYKNKNATQDAHEAIRPTYPWRTPESLKPYLSQDQFKLYDIIWKRYTATQLIPIKLSTVSIEITCGKGIFKTSGSIFLEKGFYEIYPHINIPLGEVIHKDYKLNDMLQHTKINGKQHFTKPPAHFSEAQLIKELESKGIGRPSTYATITNTIIERLYVEIKDKKFYPTELGHAVNKFLVAKFDQLFNVSFTAEMESKLDNIEYGKQEWTALLNDYYVAIQGLLSKVDINESKKEMQVETEILCDKCGSKMMLKMSKVGQFLGCSGYPQCKNIMNFDRDDAGNISVVENKQRESGIKCDKCDGEMIIKRTRTGKEFLGCSGYPKCKNSTNFKRDPDGIIKPQESKTTDEKCEKCGNDMVVKNGRFGEFLGCSGYPQCKNIKSMPLGVKCPQCASGNITKKSAKGRVFYGCDKYPDCKFITNHKPIPTKCIECENPYIEEHYVKDGTNRTICPKCKKEYF